MWIDEDKVMVTTSVRRLWEIINKRLDKKLDSVVSADQSVVVIGKNRIAAKISNAEDNLLKLNNKRGSEGLYVPKNKRLIFGAGKEYTYDGTEDVTVPVYDGSYIIKV